MSNKTSDKKVANIEIIENFIFELKTFGMNKDSLEIAHELEKILAEREQKDKRIQELEVKLKCAKGLYDDCCNCLLNSIPKQVVIDKMEENRL